MCRSMPNVRSGKYKEKSRAPEPLPNSRPGLLPRVLRLTRLRRVPYTPSTPAMPSCLRASREGIPRPHACPCPSLCAIARLKHNHRSCYRASAASVFCSQCIYNILPFFSNRADNWKCKSHYHKLVHLFEASLNFICFTGWAMANIVSSIPNLGAGFPTVQIWLRLQLQLQTGNTSGAFKIKNRPLGSVHLSGSRCVISAFCSSRLLDLRASPRRLCKRRVHESLSP